MTRAAARVDDLVHHSSPYSFMDEDFDIPEDNPILEVNQEKEIGVYGLKKKLLKVGQGSF